jgi:hypothetical protein
MVTSGFTSVFASTPRLEVTGDVETPDLVALVFVPHSLGCVTLRVGKARASGRIYDLAPPPHFLPPPASRFTCARLANQALP